MFSQGNHCNKPWFGSKVSLETAIYERSDRGSMSWYEFFMRLMAQPSPSLGWWWPMFGDWDGGKKKPAAKPWRWGCNIQKHCLIYWDSMGLWSDPFKQARSQLISMKIFDQLCSYPNLKAWQGKLGSRLLRQLSTERSSGEKKPSVLTPKGPPRGEK